MNTVTSLHLRSMELFEEALTLSREQSTERMSLLKKAFELECAAAAALRDQHSLEPSRSIIHRSAATLAMHARDYRAAERLAAEGIAGNDCPDEIAAELVEVIKQARYEKRLANEGVVLAEESLRVALDGNAVGYGVIRTDVFQQKLSSLSRLVRRTVDRVLHIPFQEGVGRPLKTPPVTQYLSAPIPGSFAVDVRLGFSETPEFPQVSISEQALGDLLTCFQLVQDGNIEELKDHIADEHYYANFMALARELLPDGDKITTLRLDAKLFAGDRSVTVTRSRKTMPAVLIADSTNTAEIEVTGVLKYADDIGGRHEVALEGDNGKRLATVTVPSEMMDDIVRPRWGQQVTVLGRVQVNSAGQPRLKQKIEFLNFVD